MSPQSFLNYAGALNALGAHGQEHSLAQWGLKIVGTKNLGQARARLEKFLSLLGFDASPGRGTVKTFWRFGPSAQARLAAAMAAIASGADPRSTMAAGLGSAEPAPPPTPAGSAPAAAQGSKSPKQKASSSKQRAAQRGPSSFAASWRQQGFGARVALSIFHAKLADGKNLLAAAEVLGLAEKVKHPGVADEVQLTPLGADLVQQGQPAQRQAALRKLLGNYPPYAALSNLTSKPATRDTCVNSLMLANGWSHATAGMVVAGFCKIKDELGEAPKFAGRGKADKTQRRQKTMEESPELAELQSRAAQADARDLRESATMLALLGGPNPEATLACLRRARRDFFEGQSFRDPTARNVIQTFVDELERGKPTLAALGVSVETSKFARELFERLRDHRWLAPSMDYAAGREVWRPTPKGKMFLMGVGGREGGAASSSGSFRHCNNSLLDFLESHAQEPQHLLDAAARAREACEGLERETDLWRGNTQSLIADFDSPEAFAERRHAMTPRLERAKRQMTTHGVEVHWGSIQDLVDKIRLSFAPGDARLVDLAQEMNLARSEPGPWGDDPSDALEWALSEVESAMMAAKKSRGPELAEAINNYATLSEQLVRSRAAMGPREKMQERVKALLNPADAFEAEELGQAILGRVVLSLGGRVAQEKIERPEAREAARKAEREAIAEIDGWGAFYARCVSQANVLGGFSLQRAVRDLSLLAAGSGGFKLSRLGAGPTGWGPREVKMASMAEALAQMPDALFDCAPLGSIAKMGPLSRPDSMIIPRPQAGLAGAVDWRDPELSNEPA